MLHNRKVVFDGGNNATSEVKSMSPESNACNLAVEGDAAALDQLFASCMPQLLRTARKMLCNPEDSEDALQDGLLSAFRHLNSFEGRAQFSTWMHAIVTNAARSILRKRRSQPLVCSLDEPLPEQDDLRFSDMLSDPRAGLEENYARAEGSRLLAETLDKLPPQHGAIIYLYDLKGLSLQETAEQLGMSISATKSLHRRANQSLLKTIKKVTAHSGAASEGQYCNPTAENREALIQGERGNESHLNGQREIACIPSGIKKEGVSPLGPTLKANRGKGRAMFS